MAREFEKQRYNVHTADIDRGLGGTLRRISWGAVFAGFVIAVVLQLAFNLLGMAIGFAVIDPAQQGNPFQGLGIGSLIYMVITLLISLFTGGWIAGRLSTIKNTFENVVHGLLAFCLFTMFNFFMITTAIGGALSGVGNIMGQALSAAAQVNGERMEQMDLEDMQVASTEQETLNVLEEQNKAYHPDRLDETMADADEGGDEVFNDAFEKLMEEDEVNAEKRQEAIDEIVKKSDLNQQEAADVVDNWVASYEQAQKSTDGRAEKYEEKAREVGKDVASGIAQASIFAFIGLVLGAGAAGFGGKVGVKREPLVKDTEV